MEPTPYSFFSPTTGTWSFNLHLETDEQASEVAVRSGTQWAAGLASLEMFMREGLVLPRPAQPQVGWTWDFPSATWVDPRTLDQIKASAWARIKAARDALAVAPITVNGLTFDADERSQARILGAIQVADIVGPAWSVAWTLADNTSAGVTRADLAAVFAAVGARTNTAFMQARTLRDQIDVASAEDLDAITWPEEPTP